MRSARTQFSIEPVHTKVKEAMMHVALQTPGWQCMALWVVALNLLSFFFQGREDGLSVLLRINDSSLQFATSTVAYMLSAPLPLMATGSLPNKQRQQGVLLQTSAHAAARQEAKRLKQNVLAIVANFSNS